MVDPGTTLTGAAAGLARTLIAAAAQKGKEFWDRENEGHKLIKLLAAAVKRDADVPPEVREQLAAALPARIRTEPEAQGALALLLDGKRSKAAGVALSQVVARVTSDSVSWPEGFGPAEFGTIVASHALEAVYQVKASDREAANVNARRILDEIEDRSDEGIGLLKQVLALLTESDAPSGAETTSRTSVPSSDSVEPTGSLITFRTNLVPDELSVYESLSAIESGEPVGISWPEASNDLFGRLASRRQNLREQLSEREIEPGPRLMRAVQQFDEMLAGGRIRREQAKDRIPLMWAGMADYCGSLRAEAFRDALQHFLVVVNVKALVSMAAIQFHEDPPLPDGLRPSAYAYAPFQNPSVAQALDADPPFWAADVTIADQSLYVYAPRNIVEQAQIDSFQRKLPSSGFMTRFVIPQVEERLIDQPTALIYRPEALQVHKLRNENFEEV